MRKLLHKKLFDMLSHRNGVIVFVMCVVMLATSAFHFGEAWLEWSQDKYASVFNYYNENISGRTFQRKLCQHVPIDAVYTWVNGSDPRRIADLQLVLDKLNRQISSGEDDVDAPFKCSFKHCVPSEYVVVSPALPVRFELADVVTAWSPAKDALDSKSASLASTSNSTIFRFASVEAAEKAASLSKVFRFGARRFLVCLGYWTSDPNIPFTESSANVVIVAPVPKETLRSRNVTSKVVHRDLLESVVAATPYVKSRLAVITFNSRAAAGGFATRPPVLKSSSIHRAFLVLRNSPLLASVAEVTAKRFRDNDELRYSLRSLEMHAPWVRHVYLVTAGQIPYWLNLDSPHLTVVSHEDIFPNKSHLPTFSSPAIESHLHRIPGLSDKFLYLNDDVLFGEPVWPEDFYSEIRGQKVYLSWDVPQCDPGCPEAWIHDGSCDLACNISACQFDGGDCDVSDGTLPNGVSPSLVEHDWNGWGDDVDGPYCAHMCSNSWLADKYCDKSCDKPECGFDAGDCGDENLSSLPGAHVVPGSLNEVSVRLTQPAFVLNLTSLADTVNVTSGVHGTHPGLRTVALSLKFRCVVVVLYRDARNLTSMSMKVSGKRGDEEVTIDIKVKLVYDYPKTTEEAEQPTVDYDWSWSAVGDRKRATNETSVGKPGEINLQVVGSLDLMPPLDPAVDADEYSTFLGTLRQLGNEKESGDLTDLGFMAKRGSLLRNFVFEFYKRTGRLPGRFVRRSTGESVGDSDVVSVMDLSAASRNSSRMLLSRVASFKSRTLKDAFGDSIRRVNNLFNLAYGFEARRVPSHTPHLIDKKIMRDLQKEYEREFEATSSHHLRTGVDMQYAFTYYYYLMSERRAFDPGEVFDEFDTDASGTWSDREIRTLLTRLNELPLTLEALTGFEQDLKNCAASLPAEYSQGIPTPSYERYVDSTLPVVSRRLVLDCDTVVAKLKDSFSRRRKYRFDVIGDSASHFKMLVSNVSLAVSELDDVRRNPRKFLCLNDDLDEASPESETVAALRADFFESLLPVRSSFELPENYRNRFLRVSELSEWRRWRQGVRVVTYLCFFVLVAFTLVNFFSAQLHRAFRRLKTPRKCFMV